MNLYSAASLARQLMLQHGLSGWTFRFDHARRRFGACRVQSRTITLSQRLTFLNSEDEIRDTILHEIAHALTPGDGHGERWKRKCVEIGARPRRCYEESDVVAPARSPARYAIGCRTCGWWTERRRLIARQLVCKTCRSPVIYREQATGKEFILQLSIFGKVKTIGCDA